MAFFGRSEATRNPASRRIFYWTLAASYLTITSTIIFLTLGYRYSFLEDIFVYTGSVNFKVEPTNAAITIDGKTPPIRHVKNFINDSRHITGLWPGLHTVGSNAPGYKPWSKEVRIRSGVATEFWNVILLREDYEQIPLNVINPERVFFTPSGDTLAYAQTEQSDDVDLSTLYIPVLTVAENVAPSTYRIPYASFTTIDKQNIEWSPDTRYLATPIRRTHALPHEEVAISNALPPSALSAEREDYVVIDRSQPLRITDPSFISDPLLDPLDNPVPTIENPAAYVYISEIIGNIQSSNAGTPLSPRVLRWHPEKQETAFVLVGSDLVSIDLSTIVRNPLTDAVTATITAIASDVVAYDFADQDLYILRSTGELLRAQNFDVTTASGVFVSDMIADADTLTSDEMRVIAYDEDRVLIIDDARGALEIYNANESGFVTQLTLLKEGLVNAQFSNDGKKLLYHTSDSAHVYFVREWESQPYRAPSTTQTILETDGQIHSVQWTPDYEHFVAAIDNGLYLAELDDRDTYRVEQFLSRGLADSNIYLDQNEYKLYFTDTITDDLLKGQINFKSITFPHEKPGIFQ